MNNLNIMRSLQLAAGGALLLFANLSQAQYLWIDAKGMKQFSDRPPPPGTPQKNILKARNMPTATTPAPVDAVAAAALPKAAPATLSEREAEYRKRKTEQAETEQKKAEDDEQSKAKLAACNAARQSKQALDTGAPIRDSNAERSFITDDQRTERRFIAEKNIANHCN